MTQQDLPMSSICELCGEPMPDGERMFKYHGYSGPCPKPPLKKQAPPMPTIEDLARTAAMFHGGKMTFKPPGEQMQTVASQAGYGHFGDAASRYSDAKWQQYIQAVEAVLDALEPVVAEAFLDGVADENKRQCGEAHQLAPAYAARIITQLKGESRE